jgi:hypothetical protein
VNRKTFIHSANDIAPPPRAMTPSGGLMVVIFAAMFVLTIALWLGTIALVHGGA